MQKQLICRSTYFSIMYLTLLNMLTSSLPLYGSIWKATCRHAVLVFPSDSSRLKAVMLDYETAKRHLWFTEKHKAFVILTFMWYLCATSNNEGIISSIGSPLSSFVEGGYQETAMTPDDKHTNENGFMIWGKTQPSLCYALFIWADLCVKYTAKACSSIFYSH